MSILLYLPNSVSFPTASCFGIGKSKYRSKYFSSQNTSILNKLIHIYNNA